MAEQFLTGPVRVRVPATSANLGPGFDALGLALGLYDEVEAQVSGVGVQVRVTGEGAGGLPLGERHLVARSALMVFDRLGAMPVGLELRCANRIPHARGLGSSSAAIIAGMLLARALVADGVRRLPDDVVLRWAAEVEGHPDNVAPCLYGGFTIAWSDASGARAVRLDPTAELRPVVLVPEQRARTEVARGLLPEQVPHVDAASNAGRAALLVHALSAAPHLLMAATEDRLHQQYRSAVMPDSLALVRQLRSKGVPAVISGAGPTVLALVSAGQSVEDNLEGQNRRGFATLPLTVDQRGATVCF